jgi:hypothetical protein
MDILLAIVVIGAWVAISAMALMRAFGSRSPSPNSSPNHDAGVACARTVVRPADI